MICELPSWKINNRRIQLALAIISLLFVVLYLAGEEIVPIPAYDSNTVISHELRSLEPTQWFSHPELKRGLSVTSHRQHVTLLRDLVDVLGRCGVQVVMIDGTLLGSYFFHDILPWDDDLDVMVDYADRHKIFQLFSNQTLRKTFGVRSYQAGRDWYSMLSLAHPDRIDTDADLKFKFYRLDSPSAGRYAWHWPYIDVKYYRIVGDTVYKDHQRDVSVSRDIFFPLKNRPLGEYWFKAPADTRAFLKAKYGRFFCKSHNWDHQNEVRQIAVQTSCSEILDYYPCVHRTWTGGQAWETLVLRGKPLHNVSVNEPRQQVGGCYDFRGYLWL